MFVGILEQTERDSERERDKLLGKFVCMEILFLIEFEMVDRDEPP